MKHYISIARPSHWFKNIFILPGVIIAALLTQTPGSEFIVPFFIGMLSASLTASANYTINEWLDAEFDRHHPLKKNRPSVLGHIKWELVIVQYLVLAIVGLALGSLVSLEFFIGISFFLIMGLLYNVKPFRAKDRAYLDVLFESVNNPIRMFLGWFIVTSSVFPPSSLIISYWMGGAFLMAVKRYAELRLIADRPTAVLYRKSFASYNEGSLLISIIFYAMTFAFFFGIFMIKYRIELILSLPLFAILFAWYLKIGMQEDSAAQRPEELYREKKFAFYILFVILIIVLLFFIEWPMLHRLLDNTFIET